MFRWARASELASESFASFLARHRCDQKAGRDDGLRWGYPWAFYNSPGGSASTMRRRTLCINSDEFSRCLARELGGHDIDARAEIPGQDQAYDTVYCFGLGWTYESLGYTERARLLFALTRPGGRLVVVESCPLSRIREVNYTALLEEIGFAAYRDNACDLFPPHVALDSQWLLGQGDVLISHDSSGRLVVHMGMVLFRPYAQSDLAGRVFVPNRAWIVQGDDGTSNAVESLGEYRDELGIYQGASSRTFWLPDALIENPAVSVVDIAACYGTCSSDSAMLLNELVRLGYLAERS
jgi:hypothetical protein